ncbi:MAG: hypothetical protein AAF197_00370 [Pseudomonadota bacterium]
MNNAPMVKSTWYGIWGVSMYPFRGAILLACIASLYLSLSFVRPVAAEFRYEPLNDALSQPDLNSEDESSSGWRFNSSSLPASSHGSGVAKADVVSNKVLNPVLAEPGALSEFITFPIASYEADQPELEDAERWKFLVSPKNEGPQKVTVFAELDSLPGRTTFYLRQPRETQPQIINVLASKADTQPIFFRYGVKQENDVRALVMEAAKLAIEAGFGLDLNHMAAAIYLENRPAFDRLGYSSGTILLIPSPASSVLAGHEADGVLSKIGQAGIVTTGDHQFNQQSMTGAFKYSGINQTELGSLECGNFGFEVGLLKANIDRFLSACGYSIGNWGLGDDEFEYDLEIPKSYVLRVKGIKALLDSIEASYLIRGTENTLDNTIDFEPSRGAILEGMEIEKW